MEIKMIYLMMMITLVLAMIIVPILIPAMKRLKYGQSIRDEGPKNHRKKSGTPTMGGLSFVFATIGGLLIFYLFFYDGRFDYSIEKYILMLLPFVGYSVIGFLDDYLIVVRKNNHGLSAKVKIVLEVIIAGVFFNLYIKGGYDTSLTILNYHIDLKWFYGVIIFFMLIGSANAVNLTDGLDGLAAGLSGIAIATFTFMAYYTEQLDLMLLGAALLGSILGFLIFNLYPAKIFMGDTGSLALGAIIASMAIMLKAEWLLILIGGVFVIETLSVILQVTYFKRTKGKRLFKMSPIHHHFELSGLSETKVVLLFYIFGFIFSLIAIYIVLF